MKNYLKQYHDVGLEKYKIVTPFYFLNKFVQCLIGYHFEVQNYYVLQSCNQMVHVVLFVVYLL